MVVDDQLVTISDNMVGTEAAIYINQKFEISNHQHRKFEKKISNKIYINEIDDILSLT